MVLQPLFFVWKNEGKNKVLDGHGRLQTLKAMKVRGKIIADLPVVYIDLPNEEFAKNLLLRICSTYGDMTQESVLEFLDGLKIDLDDIKLPTAGDVDSLSYLQLILHYQKLEYCLFKKHDCGRIAVFRNHSKIYAGYGKKFYFGIQTSANINTNPRTENGSIIIGEHIFKFYKEYFDGIKSFTDKT